MKKTCGHQMSHNSIIICTVLSVFLLMNITVTNDSRVFKHVYIVRFIYCYISLLVEIDRYYVSTCFVLQEETMDYHIKKQKIFSII